MVLLSLLAALACGGGGFVLASVPAPTAPPSPPNKSRPRFLQEAHTLPRRGLYQDGVVNMPLRKRRAPRASGIVQVPTSDVDDIDYGVAVDIGGELITLQLDTGSCDMWTITPQCKTATGHRCNADTPANHGYTPSKSFQSHNLTFFEQYGADASPTVVSGTIGADTVQFGGFTLPQQPFGLATSTNSTIIQAFNGIFGWGFGSDCNIVFAEIAHDLRDNLSSIDASSFLSHYFSAVDTFGPMVRRLASSGKIAQSMFTVSLQREEPTSEGSNAGVLTIGGLPPGISNESLTWVPVKKYDTKVVLSRGFGFNNVTVPSSLLNNVTEKMPTMFYRWEVPIDGMYVNGQLLQNSSGTPGGKLTALFDTGTTQLFVPPNDFNSPLLPTVDSNGLLPCSTAFNISFGIGGRLFAVNPYDLIQPVDTNNITACQSGLAEAPTPLPGSTFNYIFGDVMIRNLIAAYYLGNETDPNDHARIGIMSTTNVTRAESTFSSFWQSAETATPSFTFSTNDGVPTLTTTNVANPINSNAGVPGASGGV